MGCPWLFELPFPVFFPSENIMAVVNEMINGAETKWRLKKHLTGQESEAFKKKQKTRKAHKAKTQPKARPSKREFQNSLQPCLPDHTTNSKRLLWLVICDVRNRCVREKQNFSFWGEKYNKGKCFILRYFSYSKYVACHLCKGKDLVGRVLKAGWKRVLKCPSSVLCIMVAHVRTL